MNQSNVEYSEFYGLEFSERTKKPPGTDRGRNSANVPFQVRYAPYATENIGSQRQEQYNIFYRFFQWVYENFTVLSAKVINPPGNRKMKLLKP